MNVLASLSTSMIMHTLLPACKPIVRVKTSILPLLHTCLTIVVCMLTIVVAFGGYFCMYTGEQLLYVF
jgi:hypothetical protein